MTTIYHNPQCSKSRQSLQLLRDQGINPTVIQYIDTPPDMKTLKELLTLLNLKPIELVRQKEALFSELRLAEKRDNDQAILQAMLDHPKLIERPIIIHNGKATIGRPPKKVLDLLTASS